MNAITRTIRKKQENCDALMFTVSARLMSKEVDVDECRLYQTQTSQNNGLNPTLTGAFTV